MARSLVIVESPAKAKTIEKYLGRNFTVKASYGHVMDLPKKELGIDTDNGFEPTYQVIPGKTKVIKELKMRPRAVRLAPSVARLPEGFPVAALYRNLRASNPAPFAAFAQFGALQILSSSPERLLRIRGRRGAVLGRRVPKEPTGLRPPGDQAVF